MKKGTKVALWIATGCVVLGGILVGAGTAAGGYSQLERVNDNILGLVFHEFGVNWNFETPDTAVGKNRESAQSFALQGLQELEIHANLHSVSVIEGDVDEILVEGAACGEISCFVEDDTLVLQDAGNVVMTTETKEHEITLVVPRGFTWDEVEIKINLGNVALYGRVERKLDAKCNLGTIAVHLQQKKEDFNYHIEGIGNVEIDGVSYKGQGKETQIHHNAPRNMELEVSMGSIEISFE